MALQTVLLVDDDADDQLIFLDALEEVAPGTNCMTAHNGLKALALLSNMDPLPSVIFIDLNMPRMNGFELLSRIKLDDTLKTIPIAIFTTSNNPLDIRKAEEAGAQVFFSKTSNFKLLKVRLREILEVDFSRSQTFYKSLG